MISPTNKPMLFQRSFWPHPLIYSERNLFKSFQYNNTNPKFQSSPINSVYSCWVTSLSSLVKSAINKFLWDYPTRRNQLDLSSKLYWTFGAWIGWGCPTSSVTHVFDKLLENSWCSPSEGSWEVFVAKPWVSCRFLNSNKIPTRWQYLQTFPTGRSTMSKKQRMVTILM